MVISSERLPKMLQNLASAEDVIEVVILATCNRTEVYLIADRFHAAHDQVIEFFGDLTFMPPDTFVDNLYVHHDEQAVQHLFEVSAGLDSAVPGEHEILGQVRTAWDVARQEGTARRSMNLLFRHALEVGKRARTETRIAHHVTSVSQAAVIMAGERFADQNTSQTISAEVVDPPEPDQGARCAGTRAAAGLVGKRVLVIGAGPMARGMASFLADAEVSELVIANRSEDRAVNLATSLLDQSTAQSIRGVGLDELAAEIATADLVLSATGAPSSLVSLQMMQQALLGRETPLLVVDVAVPRDIDPTIGRLNGVELLDMQDISSLTEANLAARYAEAAAVRNIVEEEAVRFAAVSAAREVDPLIISLREQVEGMRQSELQRFGNRLDDLSPEEQATVDALTRAIVSKMLHLPTVRLKESSGSARGERLAESISDLFDLG
ncbi:MAG: glutamyl-tRNA reductase, partial [Microthrixaceae bacterium]